jgi:hypothetical protein
VVADVFILPLLNLFLSLSLFSSLFLSHACSLLYLVTAQRITFELLGQGQKPLPPAILSYLVFDFHVSHVYQR